jgi:hypothetical protein
VPYPVPEPRPASEQPAAVDQHLTAALSRPFELSEPFEPSERSELASVWTADGGPPDDEQPPVDWTITAAFDPDGGLDFAHTDGLHQHGLFELYLWARPSLGDDPGADWMLSSADQTGLLNELGRRMLQGRIGPGSEWVQSADAGLSTLRFRVGAPTPAGDLATSALPARQVVLPVRFSLHRPEPGRLGSVTEATAVRVDAWTRQIRAETDQLRAVLLAIGMRAPTVPAIWRLPAGTLLGDPVEVDPTQPFGPLHWMVTARAAQLTIADPHTLAEFIIRAGQAELAGTTPGHARAVLMALGRGCGRQQVLRRALAAGGLLLDQLSGSSRVTRRWREACSIVTAAPGGRPQREVEQLARQSVRDWISVTLATEAVVDQMSDRHRAIGRGPWAWAMHPQGPPGPPWLADPGPVGRVAAALADWTAQDVSAVVHRFRTGDQQRLARLTEVLTGCCTTGPGSPPRGTDLFPNGLFEQVPTADAMLCAQLARLLLAAQVFPDRVAGADRAHLARLTGTDTDLGTPVGQT